VSIARVLWFALLVISPAEAANYTIGRTTLQFGTVAVGLSKVEGFSITATTTTPVTIQSMTLAGPGFAFANGIFPQIIGQEGASISYSFLFVPGVGQSYLGTATFVIDGQPVIITLKGIGIVTTAVATPSVTTLSFSQPLGGQSRAHTVQITNTGTSTVTLLSATTQSPFIASPVQNVPLDPGASTNVSVSYFGSTVANTTGELFITYDVLPPTGISLKGKTTAASGFASTTFPSLPLGTAGASYFAQLSTAGASGNVLWSLAAGASLPSGLTLSGAGVISGTVGSTVPLTTYTFTVKAVDALSHSTDQVLSLPVLAATGAACNDISWNIAGTSTPMVPITDLGTGNYFGTEGGLYGKGHNYPTAQHDSDGVAFAKAIQPLDANGNPSASGKYALVAFGISTLLYEMQSFTPMAMADPSTNSHLVVVNGGEPTANATDFSDLASPFWTTLLDDIVPNAGVTPQQVVAVAFEDIDVFPTGTYPGDMVQLQGEFETVAQNVLKQFPNVKLMYYLPRFYAGYSGTFDRSSPEPYAYEQGFAIQGAVLDQVNGAASLNYNPTNGPVMAPWLGYGAYTWANGMIPRSDGLTYNCQDLRSDGRHPSVLYGAPKVAAQFLNFFKTNDTTAPWFLGSAFVSK
jgi:hypothetical protein